VRPRATVDAEERPGLAAWMVGLGGVGSVIAARMTAPSLLLVDAWEPNVAAIRAGGLTVTYPDAQITRALPACTVSELGAGYADDHVPEVVLLAVKSYQTSEVVQAIVPYLRPSSVVVSLQNGINEELLSQLVGSERTIGATSMLDGRLVAPGSAIQVKPAAAIVIGELDGRLTERLRAIQTMLGSAADVQLTTDIWSELWTKLVRNCMINAVSAATNLPVGLVVRDTGLLEVAVRLGCEAAEVASALGVVLVDEHLFGESARHYLSNTATARRSIQRAFRSAYLPFTSLRPSMLQDIDHGRPTEIEYMNDHVVRKGHEAGVATPVNAALVAAVQSREQGAPPVSPTDMAGRLLL
jgi:2-dehydropantoate 2-reductase